jgi:protein-disulfide isomerase
LASVAKRARSRNLYLTSSVAIIVVLLAIIGVGVQATRANPKVTSSPTLASQSSGVTWGKKAAATVRIYEDFGCTGCRTFWNSVRARLETSVRANQAQLQIVPMAVTASSNDYPMRAASAAICASDAGGDQFLALHDHLFGTFQKAVVQPAAGAAGPSNYKLQLLGRAAGLSTSDFQTYSTCVQSEKYKTFVQALTNSASQRGVSSLPAVYVNGKAVAANAGAVFAAIKSANVGVTPHPSPTPTPTPSSSASSSASASASPSSASASPSASGSAKRSGSASPSKSAGKSSAG